MNLLSYGDALRIVLESSSRILPEETVPLVLSSGRVLSRAIVSEENIPLAPNSAMDGYAVAAEDVTTASVDAPARLRIVGESAAGAPFEGSIGRGEAARIMTGGMIPTGANAVVEVEAATEADGLVEIRRPLRIGESIRRAGEDITVGREVIPAGKLISPGDVGVLASLGVTNVPTRVKPKVGLLATGNEIVEPFRKPVVGQLRNSSIPALYAYCAQAGAEPVDLGIARDDREEIEEYLEQGLRYDVLITTGGVSAGSYDFVQHILPSLGVDVKFHKVNIRPGKPILFGVYGEPSSSTLVFALPGNPVSTLVTFRQFVLPSIRRLLRCNEPELRLQAELEEPLEKQDDKRHFIRGRMRSTPEGTLLVTKTGTQSSGAMSSMSLANCLIVLEEQTTTLRAGDRVIVEPL